MIEILSKSDNQEISLTNSMTNVTTSILNCMNGERIILSSENKIASSSECVSSDEGIGYVGSHTTFLDDFNWEWFAIGNTFNNRVNEITTTGNCDINLYWRVPRKAVV